MPVEVVEQPQPASDEATSQVSAVPIQAVPSESEADAKAFIYHNESGNSPCKYNDGSPTGAIDCNYNGTRACGIGQALPCQKLTAVCQLSDYGCQDAWFTDYMKERYGTWAKAKAYWQCIGSCTNNYSTITKTDTWW